MVTLLQTPDFAPFLKCFSSQRTYPDPSPLLALTVLLLCVCLRTEIIAMKRAGVKGEIRRNSLIVCRYACKLSMFLNLGSYLPYLMTVHLALYCLTLCLVITFCSLLIFAQGFYRGRGPFYKTLVFIDVLTTEGKVHRNVHLRFN